MEANIAFPAALIGDPTRAAILMALMDGRAQPASALAYMANVTPQSASNHLAKLMDGGMLTVETQGRHRRKSPRCLRRSPTSLPAPVICASP